MRKHSRSSSDTAVVRLKKLLARSLCAAIAGLVAVPALATVVASSWFQADNVAISVDPGTGTVSFAPTSLLFMQQLGASALDSFGNSIRERPSGGRRVRGSPYSEGRNAMRSALYRYRCGRSGGVSAARSSSG